MAISDRGSSSRVVVACLALLAGCDPVGRAPLVEGADGSQESGSMADGTRERSVQSAFPAPAPGDDGKIIGENDLTPVSANGDNIPAKYRPLLNAFGKLSVGCTTTHLGDGLAVASGHCFNATSQRVDNTSCAGVTVEWGARSGSPAYLTSNCEVVLAMQKTADIDYAIFRVAPAPTAKVAMRYTTRAAVDTPLTMFSHPLGRPLEWSKTCVLRPGSEGGWGANLFSHQCDTDSGSSGAAAIDDNSLEVVGIHNGGRVPWNYATYLANTPVGEFVADGNKPPTVAFTSPASGAQVSGVTQVAAEASDSDGTVAKVVFELPGGQRVEDSAAPFAIDWDTATAPEGAQVLKAFAVDNRGTSSAVVTRNVTVAPNTSTELVNGVARQNLSGGAGVELRYTFKVPAEALDLTFEIHGSTGDADLYVRFGDPPTTTAYDYRPYRSGSDELVNAAVRTGTWYVMVRGYTDFSGLSLKATYRKSGDAKLLANGVPESNLAGDFGSQTLYRVDVSAAMGTLRIETRGGTGDVDLYVKYGSPPTLTNFDYRPYKGGNNELVETGVRQGTWYIMLHGYSNYAGVTLTASY